MGPKWPQGAQGSPWGPLVGDLLLTRPIFKEPTINELRVSPAPSNSIFECLKIQEMTKIRIVRKLPENLRKPLGSFPEGLEIAFGAPRGLG